MWYAVYHIQWRILLKNRNYFLLQEIVEMTCVGYLPEIDTYIVSILLRNLFYANFMFCWLLIIFF